MKNTSSIYVKTILGSNVGKMVDYVANNNRNPHFKSKNDKFLKSNLGHHDRVLASTGINCSTVPKEATREMKATLKRFNYKSGHPQCIHTILSFSPKYFSYNDYQDRARALSISREIIAKKYPNNQSLVALQADNKNHILHAHVITCVDRLDNGRSMSHYASCQRTMPVVDKVMKEHKLPVNDPFKAKKRVPVVRQSSHEYQLENQLTYSYMADARVRLAKAINEVNSKLSKPNQIKSLVKESSNHGLQLSMFSMKKNKQTGKHELHYYKNEPKHRGIKADNGMWLRLRKTWSIKFEDKDKKKRVVRTSKMGSLFNPNNIINNLGSAKILLSVDTKLINTQSDDSLKSIVSNVNLDSSARQAAKDSIKPNSNAKASHPTNVSSTSAKPTLTNESAVGSKVSNDTKNMMNFNHHESTHHFHKQNVQTSTIGVPNHKESTIVHSLNNEAQQTNKSVADSSPVMTFNHNQSSASAENEDNDTASKIHVPIKHKPINLMKWEIVNNIPFNGRPSGSKYTYEHLLHHKYRGHMVKFNIPYFDNPKLENLIINYENTHNNENKQDLDNFQAKCTNDDKEAISTRLTTDNKVNLVKQSEQDFNKDQQELNNAKRREKLLHGRS